MLVLCCALKLVANVELASSIPSWLHPTQMRPDGWLHPQVQWYSSPAIFTFSYIENSVYATNQLCRCRTYHTNRAVLIRSLRRRPHRMKPTAVGFISLTTVDTGVPVMPARRHAPEDIVLGLEPYIHTHKATDDNHAADTFGIHLGASLERTNTVTYVNEVNLGKET